MAWTLELGAKAPDFDLKGVDGKQHSLSDYADAKALCVIVSCNHCPTAVQYEDRMVKLQKDYADKSKGFNFPYLRDETQEVAKALGAVRTPEIFLFGPDCTLVFHGRIDDNADNPSGVTRHDLREALDELLAGKPISVPDTPSVGCTVKWWGKDAHWMPGDE
jgi:peroxiredoxin